MQTQNCTVKQFCFTQFYNKVIVFDCI